jgi:hypothetical protein
VDLSIDNKSASRGHLGDVSVVSHSVDTFHAGANLQSNYKFANSLGNLVGGYAPGRRLYENALQRDHQKYFFVVEHH